MDRSDTVSNTKEELAYIGEKLVKILLLTLVLSITVSFLICVGSNTEDCLLSNFLFIFGFILLIFGLFVSCYYSSFSLGFDAIWTPQLQGDIQRDERKRQITGWSRAFTGAIAFIIGIVTLYLYISLYIL